MSTERNQGQHKQGQINPQQQVGQRGGPGAQTRHYNLCLDSMQLPRAGDNDPIDYASVDIYYAEQSKKAVSDFSSGQDAAQSGYSVRSAGEWAGQVLTQQVGKENSARQK